MLDFNGLNSGSRVKYVGKNAEVRKWLQDNPDYRGEVTNRVPGPGFGGGKLAVVFSSPKTDERVSLLATPISLLPLL
jgi:hypothetical protein